MMQKILAISLNIQHNYFWIYIYTLKYVSLKSVAKCLDNFNKIVFFMPQTNFNI